MKRVLIVLAILLVPAVAFSGTATSRWDLTVGGQVKFQFGYADQNVGVTNAGRMDGLKREAIPKQSDAKYGNWFYGMADESNVTFLVKGPEAFGAKTTGFLQIRFDGLRTVAAAGNTWEGASIGVAWIRLDWPKTSLLLGAAPPVPGIIGTHPGNNLAYGIPHFGIKYRPDVLQATATFKPVKNVDFSIGLLNAHSFEADISTAGTNYTRSRFPYLQGGIKFTSDAAGNIGPWKLMLALSGYYGKERRFSAAGAADVIDTRGAWEADLKFYIPIIPEKKGNKEGALFLAGTIFTAQDDVHTGPFAAAFAGAQSYLRPDNTLASPVTTGYFLHAGYYFTNKAWLNVMYWRTKIHWGGPGTIAYAVSGPNAVETAQQWVFNIMYDVSPAMRMGVQYDRLKADYLKRLAGFKSSSAQNVYRFGTYYFF